MRFTIEAVKSDVGDALQKKIDQKTKPLGALGELEAIALKIGLIQQRTDPVLQMPSLLVFAGDHGITKEGVSAYPQSVTHQMVLNFLNKGAAINVFSNQHGLHLRIVDAGVDHDFDAHPDLVQAKIGRGTDSFLHGPAMHVENCVKAMEKGASIIDELHKEGCTILGFGEMGIGNTSSASMLMSLFCGLPLVDCVGKGTGLDDDALKHKVTILEKALSFHSDRLDSDDPYAVLSTFGGYEMAMMCGAMLQAASLRMVVLVDGFIATATFLAAFNIAPEIKDYALFCHVSDEQGHQKMLDHIHAKPILNLGMRLGEGTGCALAYPIIQSAVTFLNEMASFDSAGVSERGTTIN